MRWTVNGANAMPAGARATGPGSKHERRTAAGRGEGGREGAVGVRVSRTARVKAGRGGKRPPGQGKPDCKNQRLWKLELHDTKLEESASHFPPGTGKRNGIEHRMICRIRSPPCQIRRIELN